MTNAAPAPSHGPFERLEDNLWSVVGSVPGMALRRRMTVVRLGDGRLVIHSAIGLEDGAQRELEAWGEPAFIVVPSGYHRIDAPRYKARYPKAKVLCSPEAASRVRQVVPVDGSFADLPADPALRSEPVRGTRGGEHVFVVRSGSRVSLLMNDVLFNHPNVPGFGGLILRLLGSSGGPRITPTARLMLVTDKRALAAQLLALAELPDLARVVVSHVDVIDGDPASVLRRVAATL